MKPLRLAVGLLVLGIVTGLSSCASVRNMTGKLHEKLTARLSSEPEIIGPVNAKNAMPHLDKLQHMILQKDPITYIGSDLSDYMKTGAALYHEYGFVELVVETLLVTNVNKNITVEIFDMGKDANAFGIYSKTRPASAVYSDIGFESRLTGSTLTVHKDRFLVNVIGSDESVISQRLITEIASQIDKQIPEPTVLPGNLGLLPMARRIPHSEKYEKGNVLGYNFMKQAWLADYSVGGNIITLAVFTFASSKDGQLAYRIFQKKSTSQRSRNLTLANECFEGQIDDELIMVCRRGRYLTHASGSHNKNDLQSLIASALVLQVEDETSRGINNP
ncbi:MAG: hypothetical protein JXN60_04665 [Lentisphaerae bacterium]|nr:hypothetical protein [Lentisphaerota bacterium]